MVEVVASDEFVQWFNALDDDDSVSVAKTIGLLEALGVTLGWPRSSEIRGTNHPIRELRIQSRGKPLRVFYAFDPRRQAVLLIGGDKTGITDKRFYGRAA